MPGGEESFEEEYVDIVLVVGKKDMAKQIYSSVTEQINQQTPEEPAEVMAQHTNSFI